VLWLRAGSIWTKDGGLIRAQTQTTVPLAAGAVFGFEAER
jgi:hypothetical protein